MVELEKCEALLPTSTTRMVSSQNNCLCTLIFGKANTPLLTCHPVHFEVKNTHFYLILFLYYFYFIFIILVFYQGSGGFRVGSGWFWVVPGRFQVIPGRFQVVLGGPGRFRAVPAGSGRFRVGCWFYIHPF